MPSDYYRCKDFEFRYLWGERDGEPVAGEETSSSMPNLERRLLVERPQHGTDHRQVPDGDIFARPPFPGREFPANEPALSEEILFDNVFSLFEREHT